MIADFISQEIERQEHDLHCEVPVCGLHVVRMVLLGRLGYMRQRKKQLLSMADALKQTKAGFAVSAGIFRCPVPGCFRVGTIEAQQEELWRPVVMV